MPRLHRRDGSDTVMRIRPGVFFLFTAIVAVPLSAHPHVFINNKMTVQFDENTLKGIVFHWTFDDMFSNMILTDYKSDKSGQFSPEVSKEMKSGSFDNLENYHYFIALTVNGRKVAKVKIEQFSPSVEDKNKLVYTFSVPLNVPIKAVEQTVRLIVYDDTYFVAFDLLHMEDVKLDAGQGVEYQTAIEKSKVKPLWPGQYMPDNLVIRFKENQ